MLSLWYICLKLFFSRLLIFEQILQHFYKCCKFLFICQKEKGFLGFIIQEQIHAYFFECVFLHIEIP